MYSKHIEIEDGLRTLKNACSGAQTLEEFAKLAKDAYWKFCNAELGMWNCADVVKHGETVRCILAEAYLRFERAALRLEAAYLSVEAIGLRRDILQIFAGSEIAVAMVNSLYRLPTERARINAMLLLLQPGHIGVLDAYWLNSPYFDTLMQCALYDSSPWSCHPLEGRKVLQDSLGWGLFQYGERLGNAGYLVDCCGMDEATLSARRLQMDDLRAKAAALRQELEDARNAE